MQECQMAAGELVVSGGDASILSEAVEETLDQIGVSMPMSIEPSRVASVASCRDDRLGSIDPDGLDHRIGVVALVGDDHQSGPAAIQQGLITMRLTLFAVPGQKSQDFGRCFRSEIVRKPQANWYVRHETTPVQTLTAHARGRLSCVPLTAGVVIQITNSADQSYHSSPISAIGFLPRLSGGRRLSTQPS